MKYIGIVLAFLFALAIYAFAVIGIIDTFIIGEVKSEHIMEDYFTP